jgi:S1-C subfamily serine protease
MMAPRSKLAYGLILLPALLALPAASPGSAQEDGGPPPLSAEARDAVDRARTKVVILKTLRKGAKGSATGFLVRPNWVLTADHAVKTADSTTAWLNGVSYPAEVLDRHPGHDLAVLRLAAPSLLLKPVSLAETSVNLTDAEPLVILAGPSQGPEARGEPADRHPIAARFSRRLPLRDPAGRFNTMISMRASVRRGDSGSPVLRVSDGSVIGVLSSRELPDAAGISHFAYAVPVESVHAWLDDLAKRVGADADFYLFKLAK